MLGESVREFEGQFLGRKENQKSLSRAALVYTYTCIHVYKHCNVNNKRTISVKKRRKNVGLEKVDVNRQCAIKNVSRKLSGTFTRLKSADVSRACTMIVFKLRKNRKRKKNKRKKKMGKGARKGAGSYFPIVSPVKLSKTKYCLYDLRFSVHIV